MKETAKITNPAIAHYFESVSGDTGSALIALRGLILDTALTDDQIGEVEESLKWGMPSYATHSPRTGTPIRLSCTEDRPDICVLSVHCQTTLVADFKEMYPDLEYDTNRSLLIKNTDIGSDEVTQFVWSALTYHKRR